MSKYFPSVLSLSNTIFLIEPPPKNHGDLYDQFGWDSLLHMMCQLGLGLSCDQKLVSVSAKAIALGSVCCLNRELGLQTLSSDSTVLAQSEAFQIAAPTRRVSFSVLPEEEGIAQHNPLVNEIPNEIMITSSVRRMGNP